MLLPIPFRRAPAVPLRAVAFLALLTSSCTPGGTGPSPDEARELAREAWIYGYPMVLNYKTMHAYAVDASSAEYKGPFNALGCAARLYSPEDRAVVTPNSDTPYCMGWLDLRAEPVVLSVPEMEDGRYYSVQLIDGYTHNFAYVGSLSTGSEAGAYLLTGPRWSGGVPEGFDDVLEVESDFVLAIVRTQLLGAADLPRVGEIQRQYVVEPLSSYRGDESPPPAPAIDFPPWNEGDQFTAAFLEYLDFMMDYVAPSSPHDVGVRERLAALGLGTPGSFRLNELAPELREAAELGVEEARRELEAWIEPQRADPLTSTRIFGTRAFLERMAREEYGLDSPDLLRDAGAHLGLYGNSAAEAMYPTYFMDADGRPLDASSRRYELRFPPDALPPARAFWSVTMYDGSTQLLVDNPLDRYLINSTMVGEIPREPDGSLVLLIQHDAPTAARRAHWLPAPEGPFYLVLRLYGPEDSALNGTWRPPPLVAAGDSGG